MKTTEAKKKVCPHIQNLAAVICSAQPRSANDLNAIKENIPANIDCIADKCMAWHWHCSFENDTLEFSTTDGYCRLIHEGEA